MGSYVVFYMLGLYPLPATKQVLLSSPYFPEVTIYNPLYETNTTIRCTNWAEDGPVYVKVRFHSARVVYVVWARLMFA